MSENSVRLAKALGVIERWRADGAVQPLEALIEEHPELADVITALLQPPDEDSVTAIGAKAVEGPSGKPITLGDFRLIREIATGGQGRVWEAEQVSLSRRVALKVLSPALETPVTSKERFRRESLALARLEHPGIVPILTSGEAEGQAYIAMPLVPGRHLGEVLEDARRRTIAPSEALGIRSRVSRFEEAAGIVQELAGALACAHAEKIVHRDVKPKNVLIDERDARPKLIDFGLVKDLGVSAPGLTGSFVGSLHYASPEQVAADSRVIDHRTDIYSLGVLLYEMLTLSVPFEGDTTEQLFHQILSHEPPPLRALNPEVPRDLATICQKAMEKNPEKRFQSMHELAEELERFRAGEPLRTRAYGRVYHLQRWLWRNRISAAGAILVLAILGLTLDNSRMREDRIKTQQQTESLDRLVIEGKFIQARETISEIQEINRGEDSRESDPIQLLQPLGTLRNAPTSFQFLAPEPEPGSSYRVIVEAAVEFPSLAADWNPVERLWVASVPPEWDWSNVVDFWWSVTTVSDGGSKEEPGRTVGLDAGAFAERINQVESSESPGQDLLNEAIALAALEEDLKVHFYQEALERLQRIPTTAASDAVVHGWELQARIFMEMGHHQRARELRQRALTRLAFLVDASRSSLLLHYVEALPEGSELRAEARRLLAASYYLEGDFSKASELDSEAGPGPAVDSADWTAILGVLAELESADDVARADRLVAQVRVAQAYRDVGEASDAEVRLRSALQETLPSSRISDVVDVFLKSSQVNDESTSR